MEFKGRPINGYRMARCRSCRLVFACPRPDLRALNETYSGKYFAKDGGSVTGYENYEFLPEFNAIQMWPVLREHPGPLLPSTGRVLDVGCATGGFLSAAQADGWSAVGTDYSEVAAERARAKFGLNVSSGGLLPDPLEHDFDLITMWHVIEHLVEPLTALQQLAPLLKPGALLFMEAPSWGSAGRRLRGERWSQLRPPEHINFFTPASLSALVTAAGLRVLRSGALYPRVNMSLVPVEQRRRVRLRQAPNRILSAVGAGGFVRLLATTERRA